MEMKIEANQDSEGFVEAKLAEYVNEGNAKPIKDEEGKLVGAIFRTRRADVGYLAVSMDGTEIVGLSIKRDEDEEKKGRNRFELQTWRALEDFKAPLRVSKLDPESSIPLTNSIYQINNPNLETPLLSYLEPEESIKALTQAVNAAEMFKKESNENRKQVSLAVTNILSSPLQDSATDSE